MIDPNLPINKNAKEIVSRSVHHGAEFKRDHRISSMIQLPLRHFTGLRKDNLASLRFGRFVVIGVSDTIRNIKSGKNPGIRWVVRCSCGRYEIRSTKGIKNLIRGHKNAPNQMCKVCDNTKKISGGFKTYNYGRG